MVVLCTPAGAMGPLAKEIRNHLAPDAVVTDAASTKGKVCKLLGAIFGKQYVGSHPMAGSEQSGIEAADAELFDGALCIVVPGPSPDAIGRVEALWQRVGCRTRRMSAEEHDRLLARASHLPHAVASSLALAVSTRCPEAIEVSAGGFRDTTRIAAGPPAMWADIFLDNRECLLSALEEYEESLAAIRQALAAGEKTALEALLATAAQSRAALP